mgnify:CR=1 FL=1
MSLIKNKKKLTKPEVLRIVRNYSLVLLACIVLAFADAAFITPCNIVSGGVASVGIIANHFLEPLVGFDTNSLVVGIIQVVLLIVGFFVLGKEFAAKTAFASLAFPAFFALFMFVDIGKVIGLSNFYAKVLGGDVGYSILAALFGGALVGTGVALGYLGNGSTGGFDVVSGIIAKYSDMKQDVSGFIIDALLVIAGIIVFQNIVSGLIGILAAFACALAVQYVYISLNAYVIVDIISDKVEEIQAYIHNEMEHATTALDVQGGYTGEDRKMIRVVIYHEEQAELKQLVASIDPKAFMSLTTAKAINGEGFEPLMVRSHSKRFLRKKEQQNLIKKQQNPQQKPSTIDNFTKHNEDKD